VAEIADTTLARRASMNGATEARARGNALVPLTEIDVKQWRELSERAGEPNGYYLPDWELAVNASAPGRTDASALAAWNDTQLIGLMPIVSLWRAYKIPLPALASAHPYGTLCTPPLDRDSTEEAVTRLMQQARQAGARALILRDMSLDGAAMQALEKVLRQNGLQPHVLQSYQRASLDATRDAEALLHDALGTKKLKELRRQRLRLAEHGGAVDFAVAHTPDEAAAAIEIFLKLEASGWKGARGTALAQNDGDTRFIRRAAVALAATGQCEIATLRAGDTPIAAGIVLRHQDRAFYFKLGIDERFAKFSPGVQLTLDITRHLCADPAIASADSTAGPDHPMINPIWRGRLAIGDVLIPLQPNDPVVSLIQTALMSRQFVFEQARRGVRLIRAWRR
jgi:CelD/BcsL family acetyltransferase involved in cellulose biosynthesis